jgi:hypothetical protein
MPTEPGTALDMIKSEGDLELTVVVVDTPTQLRESDELVDRVSAGSAKRTP